eukprot:gene6681-7997_t
MSLDDDDGWDESPPQEDVKEVSQKSKSGEEIEKFIVDESISEIDLVCQFLLGGSAIQQQNAISRLVAVFQESGKAAFDKLREPLEKAAARFDSDDHVSTAEAFTEVITRGLLAPEELAQCLLPMALKVLHNNRDREVLDGWLDTLYALVPVLSAEVLEREVTELALSKGEVDETVQSRVICCKVLGSIAPRLDRSSIESSWFSKAMGLCQDTDYEVRICMCEQLNAICRAVGFELTKESIMPEIIELLNDEETAVRVAAFECITSLLDFMPDDYRKEHLFPIIKQYCTATDEATVGCIARLFGPLITKVVADIEKEDEWSIFYQCIKGASSSTDPKLREMCAYNFPATLKALTPRKYAMQLHGAFMQLATDPEEQVRVVVASGFHEVARMLGKERSITYLKDSFLRLLGDTSQAVQQKLLANLSSMLGMFAVTNEAERTQAYADLLPVLMTVESSLGRNWRMHLQLISTFPSFADYFTWEQIHENVIPLCFRYLNGGVSPTKTAAAAALPMLLRRTPRAIQRQELIGRFIRDYARSSSCYNRLLFVELCENLIDCFSGRFFRETFLEEAVNTLQDPVPNVRVRSAALLPRLKRIVKLPEDVDILEKMSKNCTSLTTDNDRDVAAAARRVVDEYKLTPTAGLRKDPTMSAEEYAEFEAQDQAKEQEEQDMLAREEVDNKK